MSDDHHFWHKPVPDPDLEIRKGGGGGRAVSKKMFAALQASVWSRNKEGPEPATANSLRFALKKKYDDGT